MKKKLLKPIAIALALSMPITALHAMNEQPGNHNNQSYTQQAWNYAKNLDFKSIALHGTGLTLAYTISIALHELGHAIMGEAIEPGSVKHIEILSTTPHVNMTFTNILSPAQQMALFVAGPIAGALGSYATAKGLQLICAYKRTGNFKNAAEEMHNTPILASPSKNRFIKGLQFGLGHFSMTQPGQMLALEKSDGKEFLASALYGDSSRDIPNSVAIPWNIALSAGLHLVIDKAVNSYAEYERTQDKQNNIALTMDCSK